MPTLKELMGDLDRGDGRKFYAKSMAHIHWFEPIFKFEGKWHGLNYWGADLQSERIGEDWELYIEPKTKKKVTLYRPIAKEGENYILYDRYCNNKNMFKGKIVGWQQIEVEVDE